MSLLSLNHIVRDFVVQVRERCSSLVAEGGDSSVPSVEITEAVKGGLLQVSNHFVQDTLVYHGYNTDTLSFFCLLSPDRHGSRSFARTAHRAP